jgi:tetratricopeptide (TPR) repeat protein
VGINDWHAGEHQTALEHYRQAELIEPEFCQTDYWIGRVLLDQKDYNQVLSAMVHSGYRVLWYTVGIQSCLFLFCVVTQLCGHIHAKAIGRFQKALDCREQEHDKHAREALSSIFREFLRHHPGDPSAYSNLGNILVLDKRFDEGARLYEQALALQPDQRDFLSNFGYCLFHQQKLRKVGCSLVYTTVGLLFVAQAQRVLQKALQLSPGFALASSSLDRVEKALADRRAKKNEGQS